MWRLAAGLCLVWLAAVGRGQDLHKQDFGGKAVALVKGDDNVRSEVKIHELSADRSRSLPSSEHIKLNLAAGKNDSNYAYYYYPTPPAPLTEDLSAEVYVHASKAGVKLLARIVYPRIRNPKQLDEPLTRIVALDETRPPAGGWQKLLLKRPDAILQAEKQALRVLLKGDPDMTEAYVDRLILNLYTGPGEIDVFVDNLEIGPVKPSAKPVEPKSGMKKNDPVVVDLGDGVPVRIDRGRLTIGGKKVFPRFIRYSGTPLGVLKEAGFNALSMAPDVAPELLEDAINNYRFYIVPQIPAFSETEPGPLAARDADALAAAIRKFRSRDGTLFYDLGPVRSEDYARVSRTVEAIRTADPLRPVGADVWDGFGRYAIPLQLTGSHRDPLLTSLELDRYSRWLNQRRLLSSGSRFTWTWIQTHLPDWQVRLMYDLEPTIEISEPIGPHPEQIRLLTYIALANGAKGLGYWSDRFLADSRRGKDRLLQMALLNQEVSMLEPLLQEATDDIRYVTSSHPNVTVAILRTNGKGVLALPIWVGAGAQYVPPQGSIQNLTFTVPVVPDGAEPWEITPVRVQSLQNGLKITDAGTQVTIPEFDLTAAVAFTSDFAPDGLLAAWQKHIQRTGPYAASWAGDLADEQYRKVIEVHKQLVDVAPPVPRADALICEAEEHLVNAKKARAAHNDEQAYFEAMRAMRPLRILMRLHWDNAVKTLDHPAATPYSVSYYTLPRHHALSTFINSTDIGIDLLTDGNFNAAAPSDSRGVAVTDLPGWTVQEVALDDVVMSARIVRGSEAKQEPPTPPKGPPRPYQVTSLEKRVPDPIPPQPELGAGVLRLRVTPKPVPKKKDEDPPPEPQALERVFLAVNSPPVRLPPGSWVRISGWMKVTGDIRASAEGAMLFDTTAGEAYSVRVTQQLQWKQFKMYRKVPANGEVRVRMALTGFGTVYFDDIKVEPYFGKPK